MKKTFPFHEQVRYQKSLGVTLIEALIAIGVMAILVVAGILFINQNARSWDRQAISTRLNDQLRAVEERITLDIRKSYSVTTTTSGISLVFSPTGTTTSYCQYYRQGNTLYRRMNSEIPDPITKNNIVSATFTPTPVGSPNAVLISITGSESQGTETISKMISFTVRLRNVMGTTSNSSTTSPQWLGDNYALCQYFVTDVCLISANDGSLLVLENSFPSYASVSHPRNNRVQRLWPGGKG